DPNNPSTMLVGTAGGGIWKTTNGASSWKPVNDFLPTLSVTALIAMPGDFNTLYAGTGEGFGNGGAIFGAGVFKSTDGGTTWNQLPPTANADWPAVNSMAISPDGRTILAATSNNGRGSIWRTTDAGVTWTKTTDIGDMSTVAFHPADNSKAVASGRAGQLIYSSEGGATWNQASGVSTEARVVVSYAPGNGSIVYATSGESDGILFKSNDGGQTYTRINEGNSLIGKQGWIHNVIWIDPTNPSTLVVGGLDWYRSTDGGVTFNKISKWQKRRPGMLRESSHADEKVMLSAPGFNGSTNTTVWVGNDGGVFRTQNIYTVEETAGWEEMNNSFAVTQFYNAGANSSGVIVAGAQDNGTVRYSGDAQRYTPMTGGDGGYSAADPTDPKVFYGEYVFLTIRRSNVEGAWQAENIYGQDVIWNGSAYETITRESPITEARSPTANFIAPFILDPNNSNRLLAGARSLWVTNNAKEPNSNGGPAWKVIKPPAGTSTSNNISAIVVAPGNSDIIYVGHNNGEVYRTANGTSLSPTWTRVGGGILPSRFVNWLTIDPRSSDTVYAMFGGFRSDNIWKSTDGGVNWTNIQGAVPALPMRTLAIHPFNSNWLYLGTETGIFTSEDGGQSWTIPSDGPTNAEVRQLFFVNTTLYAVTFGRGIFKAEIKDASSKSLPCYTLTLVSDPDDGGALLPNVHPDCNEGRGYTAGTVVTLRPKPRLGLAFRGWNDGGSSRSTKVTMDRSQTVVAHFVPASAVCYSLAPQVDPPGSGTVLVLTPPNCGSGYSAGTNVLLRAVPATGFEFGAWSGDTDGLDPESDIEVDGNANIIAVFGRKATNDDLTDAIDVTTSIMPRSRFKATLVTTSATNASDDPFLCETGKTGRTVWFKYTPSTDATIRIDTADSSYHTAVAVFTGSRGSLQQVACSGITLDFDLNTTRFEPDVVPEELAAVDVAMKGGTTYSIEVGDATEPEDQGDDYVIGEDLAAPEGGLLQVSIGYKTPRSHGARR
ncbi:MAG TPA: hypothetical protein VHL58_18805, partial [Thermoanaerobaculia bacterium]|nr:hypothetical protein [Thermoanaerobaculia bacterium]